MQNPDYFICPDCKTHQVKFKKVVRTGKITEDVDGVASEWECLICLKKLTFFTTKHEFEQKTGMKV